MFYNPWLQDKEWLKKDYKINELNSGPFRLPHLDEVIQQIPLEEGILSILGPRQVGKSTLLHLMVSKILATLAPSSVVLIEGEAIETWRELLSLITDFLGKIPPSSATPLRAAILIDEITSIPDWPRALKILADQGRLKFVLLIYTGSSMTSLKKGGELLPGRRGRHRRTGFEIHPVSYRQVADRIPFEIYLRIGGFPWAINEYLRLNTLPEYVGEIYWSWLKGEFLKRGKSEILFRHLTQQLSRRLGTTLSHNKLAKECGIASHETARQYLELLQDCFAIYELLWTDPSKKTISPRKDRKYYPIDPLLHFLFKQGGLLAYPQLQLSPEEEGHLAELVVCAELKRRLSSQVVDVGYWLGKREIDFIAGDLSPIEVKYQNRVTPSEFDWYSHAFPKRRLFVLTKNDSFSRDAIRAMPLKDWLVR